MRENDLKIIYFLLIYIEHACLRQSSSFVTTTASHERPEIQYLIEIGPILISFFAQYQKRMWDKWRLRPPLPLFAHSPQQHSKKCNTARFVIMLFFYIRFFKNQISNITLKLYLNFTNSFQTSLAVLQVNLAVKSSALYRVLCALIISD